MRSHFETLQDKFNEWCAVEKVGPGSIPVSVRDIKCAFERYIAAEQIPTPSMSMFGRMCRQRFPRFDRPADAGQRYLLSRSFHDFP